ncbi:MAG: hypothetical protein OZ913_09410 [Ignavibacteriaceae bacterium]|jgi:hypothetical protein|nr:MAG: hypothetical protein EDM69_02925 [Chlorobiota bacterium]KXK04114.1 MAG: hypothetical protein UZ04_CHB001001152 [Chlorobi bacterium OLB4]MBV6397903.1 hypothetical protein [Ignavibacteria bacterium]MCC6884878.1 hypothetical protein [Ignavibacteriales bacterium]MCE7952577.1 hypothetical protein [Chlorobi bacterium CHB7]MDL1886691.1 hypothetical protein [Ignavibacteria bacterium CHB1]MEB2330497.1 hypothetical protein [Ignavibacteriaceae bacterium]OQY76730.1 MAG: hypothetical protein B6D4
MTENTQISYNETGQGGNNSSNGSMEERIENLLKLNNEISEIKNYVVQNKMKEIEGQLTGITLRAMIPSLILLILSIFIDISAVPIFGEVAKNIASWIFPGVSLLNQGVVPIQFWWMPFLFYIIFVLNAYLCNSALKKEILQKGASENSIDRIIDKYSGVVDGIGTALPLLGAAILLVSIKEGPTIFLGFSVPFEIKAIVILAIAKLFESVFSAQAVKYQEIQHEVSKVEREYFAQQGKSELKHIASDLKEITKKTFAAIQGQGGPNLSKEQLDMIYNVVKTTEELNEKFTQNLIKFRNAADELSKVKLVDHQLMEDFKHVADTMTNVVTTVQKSSDYSATIKDNMNSVRQIVTEINNVKLPEEKVLKELQVTAHFIGETIKNLNDSSAIKGLDNLAYLAGKRQ